MQLVAALQEKRLTITTAESCTGGMIAAAITDIPGSSGVFPGGIVSYSDRVKHDLLSVPQDILDTLGAVSQGSAEAMATGAARRMGTDLALSATGIAGPQGDGSDNPVGTVYLGLFARGETTVEHHVFPGDRNAVRRQATDRALSMALEWIQKSES